MKPVSSKVEKYRKDGCMPISASCVVWNGLDIPCINLCKGDTIDDVVYELAQILCDITENVLDITTLDFKCLIEDNQCAPKTLLETLQLLITKVCTPPAPPAPGEVIPLPNVNLPECLWYVDSEGDTVTALPLDQYASYLASQICSIIANISSITTVINSLNQRVTLLENAGGGSGGSTPITNITTQCLSGSTSGLSIPIATAFFNLEQRLCEYLALLGTLTEWQTMFNNICITSTTPLPCGTGTYGDLAGWITNPTTVASAMTNLWLTVCKLNSCLSTTSDLQCVLVPPVSASLSNLTTTSCKVTWIPPSTPTSQPPLAYKIEVYTLLGVTPLSSVIVGPTPTNYTISNPSIVAGEEYIVKVYAVYECGTSSSVQTQGILMDLPYIAKLFYENAVLSSIAKTCTNPVSGIVTAYTEVTRRITISLKDGSGNLVTNLGSPIVTSIQTSKSLCPSQPNQNTTASIIINSGNSSATYDYVAEELIYCAGAGTTCTTSLVTITCYEGSTLVGPISLPPTIGIDSSLTNLGTC